ncbi:methyltransferase domain-containing protein [Limibacter armeniacum]|uniref:SAM-dependent methyltransferase n=1 Tax=Limibacter armeniacum TaxID=466084 RepID=UPI002FE585FD
MTTSTQSFRINQLPAPEVQKVERIKFDFGKSQLRTGKMMKRFPKLGKLVYNVFGYTNIGNYARAQVLTKLLNKLPLTSFQKVLDLGCGYGEFSFMVAEKLKNLKVTALDIDSKRIEKVRDARKEMELDNVEVFEGKIDSYPEDEHFDLIFSVDVFEHIYVEQMPFKDCFQKLKPGGYLLVKMPNITQETILPHKFFKDHNEWLDDEHVGQVLNLEGLVRKFASAGFEVKYAANSDGKWARAAWEIGYFSLKAGPVVQLAFLPLCKALIHIDKFFDNSEQGNAIQVIGRKPYKKLLD